jgi:hypothetical protein
MNASWLAWLADAQLICERVEHDALAAPLYHIVSDTRADLLRIPGLGPCGSMSRQELCQL